MGDLKLFDLSETKVKELPATTLKLERTLQAVFEDNLETILGVRFLASEYVTTDGRMDTLGIDENGYPVIIEYKRHQDQNVINQGLFYLNWLMDHKAAFELLVRDKLGLDVAKTIEWSSPRLICIAGNFKKYDTFAVKQMPRNIELIRFALFDNDKLLLDQLTSTSGQKTQMDKKTGTVGAIHYRTVSEDLEGASSNLVALHDETHEYLIELGDDVQQGITKFYIAYKRIKNFACMEIKRNVGTGIIRLYLKINPDNVDTGDGFARDVRKIGHYGTGDLELTIANSDDLERAKPLIQKSYETS